MSEKTIKAKVLKQFRNKYSKNTHRKGDIIEISQKRYDEINSTKHGQLVKEIIEDTEEE